jgi:uncharacterized protein YdeI (YjbR/CyaY-like superfamily)
MDEVVFFKTQCAFDDWLNAHPNATEVWVGYYKKKSGQAGLDWSGSVDVALCHGWIDGIRKTIDDQRYKIRFTPRKINSVWSAVNVQKVEALIPLGRMLPAGLHLFQNRSQTLGYSAQDRNVPLDDAYATALRANPAAWAFFTNLAPSYKRDSVWWVMNAKREDTRLKRLGILIESSAQGLKIPSMRKK